MSCMMRVNQNKSKGMDEQQVVKRRLRTLGPRLQQELQVTIPHDLDRLESYRAAIENSQRVGDWDTLRRDQRNATLTIKDLKTHVQLLEDLREEVREEDVTQFDKLVEPTRQKVVGAVESFLKIDPAITITSDEPSNDDTEQLMMVEMAEGSSDTWQQMEQELVELREMTKLLNQQVSSQGPVADHVEQEIATASNHTNTGRLALLQSVKIKAAILPVGGAIVGGVIGGVVGGPVGAFAGLKIGAVAAVAGGTAGAVGGGWLGYRRSKQQTEDIKTD